jgi:hypothetical protein
MNLQKLRILFILPVLFTWLSISEVNGAPRLKRSQQGFSWKDTRLNVEFDWGAIPYGKFLKLFDEDYEFDTHFNYSARILAGYSFSAFEDSRIGFETGLGYGFGRVIENKEYNATFEENHLVIPLLLTIFKPFQTSFYCAHTFIIGYEFDIILSSMYKQSGYYLDLHPSLQGDKDVAEFLPDFSRLSGNVIVSGRYDFPKGIYAGITCRLPIEIFEVIKDAKKTDGGLDMTYVRRMRWFSANWIELTVGVNIVDWIYPQEGYPGKSNWKKR